MSQEEIKLDYAKAEEMAKTFRQGAAQLQETMQAIQQLAQTLEGGALRGRGGTALVDALRGKLSPAIKRLADKYHEMDGDVKAAIEAMREADKKSARQMQ